MAGLQALNVSLLCKNKKKGGSAGASPVAALCLEGECFLRTFHQWGDLIFIVYVFPNWMVIKIISYWTEDFLSLSLSD